MRNVNLGAMPIRLLPDPSRRWIVTQPGNITEGGAGKGYAARDRASRPHPPAQRHMA